MTPIWIACDDTTLIEPTELRTRTASLEAIARGLTREQIMLLSAAVKDAPDDPRWRASLPYWFQGTAGVKLSDAEVDALKRLWTRTLAGLAFAVGGEEVGGRDGLPWVLGWLDRLVPRDEGRETEAGATDVLERTLGGDVWPGVVGAWNAFCAVLLRERLEPALRSSLGATWRRTIGTPPAA